MTNRVVGNGTPLDGRFDNVALAAARAGYRPTLFGYTDQGIDPRLATGPTIRGFQLRGGPTGLRRSGSSCSTTWRPGAGGWRSLGYDGSPETPRAARRRAGATGRARHLCLPHGPAPRLAETPGGPLVRARELPGARTRPMRRPAGGRRAYDTRRRARPLPAARAARHHLRGTCGGDPGPRRTRRRCARLSAQYYGMISDVDEQLGRLFDGLSSLGMWEDTFIVVTSDHGEQLGDQGRSAKGRPLRVELPHRGHRPRPCVTSDRRDQSSTRSPRTSTSSPRICEAMGIEVPAQCDGLPLTAFLAARTRRGGATPPTGNTTGAGSTSSSAPTTGPGTGGWRTKHLAVVRTDDRRLRAVRRRRLAAASTWPPTRPGAPRSPIPPCPRARPGDARLAGAARRAPARRHAPDRRRGGPDLGLGSRLGGASFLTRRVDLSTLSTSRVSPPADPPGRPPSSAQGARGRDGRRTVRRRSVPTGPPRR